MGQLLRILVSLVLVQAVSVPRGQDDCVPGEPARVWSSIAPATVRTRVEPDWPLKGRNDSQGTIILDAWIDARGDVACVKVLRGLSFNDKAATDAVRRWTFHPATFQGRPVAVVQRVLLFKKFS